MCPINTNAIFKYALLPLLLVVGIAFSATAQKTKAELEKERLQLEDEIKTSQKLLEETSKNRKLSIDKLETLQKQINSRERLIGNYEQEIALIQGEIEETASIIDALERDLRSLKKNYAAMLVDAYMNRSTIDNRILFIFSAESFNEGLKRVQYLKNYNDFKLRQAQMIQDTKDALDNKVEELAQNKADKKELLDEVVAQKAKLDDEKAEENHLISALTKQEKKLKQDIDAKKKAMAELDEKIKEIIEAELNKKTSSGAANFAATPEGKALSADFAANKGNLPWPVDKGIISGRFGEQPHPVLKNIKIQNNGIDIKTHEGATARAVFKGKVSQIIYNPGFQKAVLVNHGEYYTVYSNLKDVYVEKGEMITTKQQLGLIFTDRKANSTEVHFEIWKGTTLLNPALWIYVQ